MSGQENQNQPARTYSTVKQFAERYPAFPVGGMRHRILNASKNGLAASGAIVRCGGKVLIDEPKFFAWIDAQNQPKVEV